MRADETKTGVELIAAERARQVEVEGWTPEHDDEHGTFELSEAAVCYMRRAVEVDGPPNYRSRLGDTPPSWPWDWAAWKPSDDPIRNLVKAGALVAAEIDRLQRAEATHDR